MSVFLMKRKPGRFPVPLLALELFATGQEDRDPVDAILYALKEGCGIADPGPEDLDYFVARLEEVAKEVPEDQGEKTQSRRKSLGTDLYNTLNGMHIDMLLLAAVGHDFEKAEQLYCEADRNVAMAVVEGHLKLRLAEQQYLYECVLYGFGGSYKDDVQAAPEDVLDLTKGDVDPIAVLDQWFN